MLIAEIAVAVNFISCVRPSIYEGNFWRSKDEPCFKHS